MKSLTKVPWIELNEDNRPRITSENTEQTDYNKETIKKRLEDLGYTQ